MKARVVKKTVMEDTTPVINRDDQYVVMYRMGGTLSCEWRLLLKYFSTIASAQLEVNSLELQGYQAIFERYPSFVERGLPVGYFYKSDITQCHPHDFTEITKHYTKWTSHELLRKETQDSQT